MLNFIDGDSTVLESTPLSKLTKKENLTAFKHEGLAMHGYNEGQKFFLEKVWKKNPPWKNW